MNLKIYFYSLLKKLYVTFKCGASVPTVKCSLFHLCDILHRDNSEFIFIFFLRYFILVYHYQYYSSYISLYYVEQNSEIPRVLSIISLLVYWNYIVKLRYVVQIKIKLTISSLHNISNQI